MTTIRVFTVIAALASASAVFADTAAKAPADKKTDKAAPSKAAPDKAAPDKAAPDKASKKETLSDAEAQKFLVFFDQLINIVVANQDDCAKMAVGINGHVDANQALIKEANEAKNRGKDLPASVKDKLEKRAREELQPAITKKCVNDKTVQAAFMRMGPGKK